MIIFENVIINLSEWILDLFFFGLGMFLIVFTSISAVMFLFWITGRETP